MEIKFGGDLCHDLLKESIKPKLSFDKNADFGEYRAVLRAKYEELLGIQSIKDNACPLNIKVEYSVNLKNNIEYSLTRFTFESEKGCIVPCYLVVPNTGKKKYPLMVTLQGHSTGMYNSIGVLKLASDAANQPRVSFAIQAVEKGYAALCVEQRGMGEQCATAYNRGGTGCTYTAMSALVLGRTIIGERVWDISRALDCMSEFDKIDTDNVSVTGHSGGGTSTYYVGAFDERFKMVVPVDGFCSYVESILTFNHCTCNYIPNVMQWFDMQDLAALIAPRKLIIINGLHDDVFPRQGVNKAFETIKAIYEKAGVANNCKKVSSINAHFWNPDVVWPAITSF